MDAAAMTAWMGSHRSLPAQPEEAGTPH